MNIFQLFAITANLVNTFLFFAGPVVAIEDDSIVNPHRHNIDHETLKLLVPISRYAQISYCLGSLESITKPFRCRYGCTQFPNSEVLFEWWEESVFLSPVAGYVVADHKAKQLIVMFRGAHSVSDVYNSLFFRQTDFVPFDSDPETWKDPEQNPFYCNGTVIDPLTGQYTKMGCKVHEGVQNMYYRTMEMCGRFVSERASDIFYKNYRFIIAGHSLGGIIATIVGADFKIRGLNPTVISLGSPKFANRGFTKWFDNLFDTNNRDNWLNGLERSYFRVTQKHDAYTHLPLGTHYAHTSGEVFISNCDDPAPREDSVYFCSGEDNTFCSYNTPANPISLLFTEPIHMKYFTDLHGCALEHSYVPIKDVPPPLDPENPYS